ncbi:MAG: hypothetical protein IKK60_01635 [Clostridia bacterium]|nr:hypothetical protein [Clostridia bacterium]
MTISTVTPSIKAFLSGIVAFIISLSCLLLPANPDNVNLDVKGYGSGTDDFFLSSYCYVTVNMENKTNRTMEKPDYAVLEKESDGQWIFVSRGNIPQEDFWTMLHGGDTTETFYFWPESVPPLSPGEYRITVYYSVKSLSAKGDGQASRVFTVS